MPTEFTNDDLLSITLPGIKKACLLIAYDNDFINRDLSEAAWLRQRALPVVMCQPIMAALRLSSWLDSLTDDQLETLCCGETTKAAQVCSGAPDSEYCHRFLEEVFNVG